MALISTLLALRRDARVQKVPPYLSALLVVVGIAWLFLLPLNDYSRRTYVSENALLPAQVHTYFGGSEHNIFRAYRQEVAALAEWSVPDRSKKLEDLFRESNLKVASQKYAYESSNVTKSNENVYAILQGPRADATEAIVLIAAWKNMDNEINYSGVALVLSMARYFKKWSLWSKDVIFLITGDSTSGSQAWVDAYHDAHDPATIESLSIKSGALQGAVAVDYPAGTWGHRYDKLHIVYDGINGQLPNLDLINTAVNIAGGQMGISSTIQRMWSHSDSYRDRLQTIFRGMVSQSLGHATGPHSAFISYHVDAITLKTVGDGWHDEMSLGRTVESIFRSLNNLLEKLHQSFFFYLLLESKRFVSIGTYLPSAMLIAASFSIMAIAKWVESGKPDDIPNPASTKPPPKKSSSEKPDSKPSKEKPSSEKPSPKDDPSPEKETPPPTKEKQEQNSPKKEPSKDTKKETSKDTKKEPSKDTKKSPTTTSPRPLSLPLLLLLTFHFFPVFLLFTFNNFPLIELPALFQTTANVSTLLPLALSFAIRWSTDTRPTRREINLLQSFSLLFLGMCLSTLATINFSLSFFVGLACVPFSFVRPLKSYAASGVCYGVVALLNPVLLVQMGAKFAGVGIMEVLIKAAEGWQVWGLWTQVVVWLVWFPAWTVAAFVVALGFWEAE
ncbi:Glycosylphosphatidylinositol:protein transamidase, GAA1 component [Periconia macrospinosa]|uniref:Glycosylphosphatidylinositol:protein transamidase, GAA1 component n=1 Tax=Periconia macrospinosa TaxID=97972 RepID=A0A2V1DEK8_9PLEO|nr:Glycosylphosphatidylinositol:protein transamidase, GAA1 component [Periconia macrospinosa]